MSMAQTRPDRIKVVPGSPGSESFARNGAPVQTNKVMDIVKH